jgi:transposase
MVQPRPIDLSSDDRARLEAVVADHNAPQKHAWRAKIVLLAADGASVRATARRTGKAQPTVLRWRRRFQEEGTGGLPRDKSRPPGTPPVPPGEVRRVLDLTAEEPPGEATHWTGRMMARAAGLSLRSVQRIWHAHGLTPHRLRRFKLSNDPAFAAKLLDVVGLDLDPPAHAVVLSVDEKSHVWMAPSSQEKGRRLA